MVVDIVMRRAAGAIAFIASCVPLWSAAPISPITANEPISLHEVLTAAAARSELSDSSVVLARGQIKLLESLSKRRFELRPQLGILTFTQPALLATSIGSSLLFNRGASVSPFAMQGAQLDLVTAELAAKRARLQREIRAAHRFFELAENQEAVTRTCAAVEAAEVRRREIERLIRVARLTMVDKLRNEEEILDRRSECVQAEAERHVSAALLSSMIGSGQRDIRVRDQDTVLGFTRALPDSGTLVEIAQQFRAGDPIARELDEVRSKIASRSRFRSFDFSLTQANVRQTGTGLSNAAGRYLLGGNMFRPEMSFSIPLRNTGERTAEQEILAARLKRLEAEAEDIEDEIRNELTTLRTFAQAGVEKLALAEEKARLAGKAREIVAIRFHNGLASPAVLFDAEREELRAQNAIAQTRYEAKARVVTVLVLCGLHNYAPARQEQILTATKPTTNREAGAQ